ncbi:hypothetical protein CBR14_22375, partial [Cronobacter sakazakii]
VIGYDDTYESSFFYPALTTVSLDLDMQGKEAVRRLLEASGSDAPRLSSLLPARLGVRPSPRPREDDAPGMRQNAAEPRPFASRPRPPIPPAPPPSAPLLRAPPPLSPPPPFPP